MCLNPPDDFVRDHQKAFDAIKYLNDYCCAGGCTGCEFYVLKDCPFYVLDKDKFDILKEEAGRLSENEKT